MRLKKGEIGSRALQVTCSAHVWLVRLGYNLILWTPFSVITSLFYNISPIMGRYAEASVLPTWRMWYRWYVRRACTTRNLYNTACYIRYRIAICRIPFIMCLADINLSPSFTTFWLIILSVYASNNNWVVYLLNRQ